MYPSSRVPPLSAVCEKVHTLVPGKRNKTPRALEKLKTEREPRSLRAASSSTTLYVRDVMLRDGWMREILARRREEGTFRELRTPEQDRCFVDFTSNDFLGLGRAADLRHAIELEAARVRQACCTLRGPIRYRDTNAKMFSCACTCRGFFRYSFDEIQPVSRFGRVAFKRQHDDKTVLVRPSSVTYKKVRAIF